MNKFQQERAQVLRHKRFLEERKNKVLAATQKKKTKRLIPATILVAIACFALFFMLSKEQSETPIVQSYTETSLKETLIRNYYNVNADLVQFPYIEMNVSGNDAVVVTYIKDFADAATIHYATFINNQWTFETASLFTLNEEGVKYDAYATIIKDNVAYAVGMLPEGINRVIIGDEEATTFKIAYHTVWIGKMNTAGTPMFYDIEGGIYRWTEFPYRQPIIPFVEAVGNEYVTKFWADDMHIKDEEYSKFAVVVDPYYYAENAYQDLDVVVVEVDGKPYITRILIAQGYDTTISVMEGTVVLNNNPMNHYFTVGRWNGDAGVYHDEIIEYGLLTNNQVFVMPDNWASKGIRGFIDKTKIIGKVIGYSKTDLPFQWTEEELKLYNKFRVSLDDQLLTELSAQQIVRLQRLAEYMGDYPTVYELYSTNSMIYSYDEWYEKKNLSSHVPNKVQLNYDAYMMNEALLDTLNSKLKINDENENERLSIALENENHIWKVKYETVTRVYNY